MIEAINSLSIVITVFNEEKRLKKNLIKIINFIKNKKIEVIFVNDGSSDSSEEIIKKIIKKNKKIKIISLRNNTGKGGALKKGVMNAKYKWILTMDLDLSVPLSQIFTWYKKKYISNHSLIYFGSRNHRKSIIKFKIHRKIFGKFLNILTKIFFNINIKDTQCGYKLYKNNVGKLLFSKITRFGYEHDIEIAILAKNRNISIRELPVKWFHKEESKVNILIDSIKLFFSLIILKRRYLNNI